MQKKKENNRDRNRSSNILFLHLKVYFLENTFTSQSPPAHPSSRLWHSVFGRSLFFNSFLFTLRPDRYTPGDVYNIDRIFPAPSIQIPAFSFK